MGRVVLDNVTKRFDHVLAVDHLSLEVADREFLVLLGPSGCGKSTVLRLVAGLEEPTEGSITIGDRVVDDVEAVHRDVAMVFQSYALYPYLTVRRNIEFPLRRRRVPAAERSRRVAEVARSLGLEPLLDRKPAKLSGGQRQRVALARAIVRRPQVFLMDEPLSNLDAKLRVQTRAELVELHRRLQTTFLYVTHDQVEAMTMGSRIAVVAGGVLQQVGSPQDVYDRPANTFVAQFLGSPPMNVVAGEVTCEGESLAVRLPGGWLALSPEQAAALAAPAAALAARPSDGKEVLAGVRPEHIRLGPGGHDGGLRGEVKLVESLGHERHVVCSLDRGAPVVVRLGPDERPPAEGEAVRLRVSADRLHLFDPSTGDRIA